MDKLNDAIKRIEILECPTGKLEERVVKILEDYNVANRNNIFISREEEFDRDGAEAYRIDIGNASKDSLTVLAVSGPEDYVAKVVNIYKNNY